MSNWLLDQMSDARQAAIQLAVRAHIRSELLQDHTEPDEEIIQRSAEVLELAVLELLLQVDPYRDQVGQRELRSAAADAFRLMQAISRPEAAIDGAAFMLRASALAVLGDKGFDASRWLKGHSWPALPMESGDWRDRTFSTVLEVWLRLIRKDGWNDRDAVLELISRLRDSQEEFEQEYLQEQPPASIRASAIELVVFYQLAKAAEILALYTTDGVVDGNHQVQQLLDMHFDKAINGCQQTPLVKIEPLCRLLTACAKQLAENSIWTVTRAVNSRVTKFVKSLVDRGRGNRALFEVLPPQRHTLAERGLLGSSRRAVVVSLPTSSGKTLIAEFRILQALNQFDHENGWVAYLAPTRALVNQVTRQLRRDLEPLGIEVEQVSPALEIDSVEAELLGPASNFRVLVTTPEKLDLMIRQGCESSIGRPLTLVIVDEAHNLQSAHRGLSLELLLATINVECKNAQFLLLTPFIDNAEEVARWLGGTNSDDISLAVDWQPNDRLIGIVQVAKGEPLNKRSYDYQVDLRTLHTSRHTLAISDTITLPKDVEVASTYRIASEISAIAALTAQALQSRGPVIVMHARPDWVWSLADRLKVRSNRRSESSRVKLVQEFLQLEFGDEFPLIDLISFGIGVHHAGLSDEVRALMEWLFELGELQFLVATTTIAQGVNFPISGVVMASHRYTSSTAPFWSDMPASDFWNIAGRAGRVSQGSLGVVALAARDEAHATELAAFVDQSVGNLNSALINLAIEAGDRMADLGSIVYRHPEWSNFVQYLAHSYRQMEDRTTFQSAIEPLLRNTFGFDRLRSSNPELAKSLLDGVLAYADYLATPGQPIALVDSTGFSLQSIRTAMAAVGEEQLKSSAWNEESLFSHKNNDLQSLLGVMLRVPELRDSLKAVTGGDDPDGSRLALIVKDWVNGMPLPELANRHFYDEESNFVKAITKCGQNLFGKLTHTTAWGLGALLSITSGSLDEAAVKAARNLPSWVYYGVNSHDAIKLRLLGVSRLAASKLAGTLDGLGSRSIGDVRASLKDMDTSTWQSALGEREGEVYHGVWRALEGLE